MAASATRRSRAATKWQPPPPPSPKILHFPRRIKLHPKRHPPAHPGRNLRSLFDEEEKSKNGRCWKSEAETLRSECDSLRMERDAALRELHKAQVRTPPYDSFQHGIRGATSKERKKIDGADCIERKMEKLKTRSSGDAADREVTNVREVRGIEESSKRKQEIINVEMLKRKMEGLSKGMIERMEEYGSFLLSSVSPAMSGRQSQRRTGRGPQEVANQRQLKEAGAMSCGCCCKCKEVVLRIAEGVRAETGQWAELQEMLEQVRLEMDELRSSRDLWQRRAVDSELALRALRSHMLEWKRKAQALEQVTDDRNTVRLPKIKCQQQPDQRRSPDGSAMEKEKHVLVYRLNNPKGNYPRRRSPLQEIGNLPAER